MNTDIATNLQRIITTIVFAVVGVIAKYLAASRLKWMDKEREEELDALREERDALRVEVAVLKHRLGEP